MSVSEAATHVFGDRVDSGSRLPRLVGRRWRDRGLIGPREVDASGTATFSTVGWSLSSLAPDERVADIGSGAGLPGIPLAIARPDLRVVLVEPLLRRTTFLAEVVDELGLDNVTVVRGRAEEPA